ncbi:MAG: F0F1 ATP synthase subunit B [Gammaproteobacteria bacterium]|nr:F0F1 ATP synthase subunit B [Gammaproteobacteria bacterium]
MSINLTLFGQAISLFIFVWFCMKYVWPPIINALHEREKRIADGLAAADAGQDKLVEADQRLVELVDEGKQKANEIIVQAQKRGDEILEEAKHTAREEGERLIEAAHAEIERERTQARDQLRQEVATLALAGAERILMREVDKNAHDKILAGIGADL